MADIQVSTFEATDTPSLFPTRTSDTYGYHYPFELLDEAVFSFTVPDTYVAGNALSLKVYERSEDALDHKWQFVVGLGDASDTVTQECEIVQANLQTIQTIVLTDDGILDGVAVAPEDLIQITMKRVATAGDEDTNPIRVYAVIALSELEASSGCLGRVGEMVDSVLLMLNEITNQDFVKPAMVIRWFNECTKLLAADEIWTKISTVTWPSGAPEYIELMSQIPDIRRIRKGGIRLASTTAKLSVYPSTLEFATAKKCGLTSIACVENNRLWIYPVPAEGTEYTIDHSYCPDDMGCAANTTPPVDLASELVYQDYGIGRGCLMDRTNKNAQAQGAVYMQSFERRRRDLKFQATPSGASFKPSR